jgi:Tol biopolymer transport system component
VNQTRSVLALVIIVLPFLFGSTNGVSTTKAPNKILTTLNETPGQNAATKGTTERVSIASDGTEASYLAKNPGISANGRFVAFESSASNLVDGDLNFAGDIFVHDRETGKTELISVASDDRQGDSHSTKPSISATGRFVAFESAATNLVPGDTNDTWDIFVHDRETGITERVSVATDGSQANRGTGGMVTPSISADGRFVAFASSSDNLVSYDTNESTDIFVRDRQTGLTERVSVNSYGGQGNAWSQHPSISADGRFVAFISVADNLVDGHPLGFMEDAYVHDRETGQTEQVSIASDGSDSALASLWVSVSGDGRYAAFQSISSNLVEEDTNDNSDIFVHDRETRQTERVSVTSDGREGNGGSIYANISANGRFIAFESMASNLVPGDTNDTWDIFVHDRETGITERVSVATDGNEGNQDSNDATLSNDGRYIAFESDASNLVPEDTNDYQDVFIRDRVGSSSINNISISHIEVTQGIQDESNNVPLIAGKPTLARVYLDCGNSCTSLSGVTGELEIVSSDSRELLSPHPATVTVSQPLNWQSQRPYPWTTLNFGPFELNESSVTMTATVSGVTETITLTVEPSPSLRIGYLPIPFNGTSPDPDRIDSADSFLEHIYPLSSVDYFEVPWSGAPYSGGHNPDALKQFLNNVFARYEITGWPQPAGEPDQLYGWVPHDTWGIAGSSDPVWNGGSGLVAFSSDTESTYAFYQIAMAHELGHNFGRRHPCNNQDPDWPHEDYAIHDVGFDFGFYHPNSIVEDTTDDFMIGLWCGATFIDYKWISAYTFRGLHQELASSMNSMPSLATNSTSIEVDQVILLVSGRVFSDGKAELYHSYQLTAKQPVTQRTGSSYCLHLKDDTNNALVTDCFDLSFVDVETQELQSSAYFVRKLEYNPGATRLVLTHETTELVEQLVSPNPPTITLTSPNGEEVVDDIVNVTWIASDADADPLEYSLAYSADSGASWYYLGIGITEQNLTVDMSKLPGSSNALWKVTASDGINTVSDTSDSVFMVPDHSPKAIISLPQDGVVVHPGQPLLLQGRGQDPEDGVLDDSALSWFSDRDGDLGTGTTLLSHLTPGEHQITLVATDKDGKKDIAKVRVSVGFTIYLPSIRK